jgi:hypothetical protein
LTKGSTAIERSGACDVGDEGATEALARAAWLDGAGGVRAGESHPKATAAQKPAPMAHDA